MIGKTISHYKILSELGRGGMGVVYKARDLHLDRFVALKFLPYYFSSDEQRKNRFIYEAKTASALDHPNIGTIYEFNTSAAGQMFIAMAYYHGKTLKKKIEDSNAGANGRSPLQIAETIDIAIQICRGLARAHQAGITHCDIKPSNIILTNHGEVKIVDFGVAKIKGNTRLSDESATPGTVAYMSPEQTVGDSVDHRTDIWSLGVVLYEMITGEHPFKGDYDQAVIYSILREKPKPLSHFREDLPPVLRTIVNRSFAKTPTKVISKLTRC